MRKFKYSYKQMWSFAHKSKGIKKQSYWLKRIYSQKIKEAERKGEYGRSLYLRSLKSDVRNRVKRNLFPIRKMNWKVVSSDSSNLDKLLLILEGKKGGKNGEQPILIYDDNAGTKLIAYEGTEIYDEIIQAKRDQFGEPEMTDEEFAKFMEESLKE